LSLTKKEEYPKANKQGNLIDIRSSNFR